MQLSCRGPSRRSCPSGADLLSERSLNFALGERTGGGDLEVVCVHTTSAVCCAMPKSCSTLRCECPCAPEANASATVTTSTVTNIWSNHSMAHPLVCFQEVRRVCILKRLDGAEALYRPGGPRQLAGEVAAAWPLATQIQWTPISKHRLISLRQLHRPKLSKRGCFAPTANR